MAQTTPRGRFVWHELMTTDPDGASAFYKKVVGWQTQNYEHDPSYRLWAVGDRPVGGLMPLGDEARRMRTPPNWLAYIAVPDVDKAVSQAEALGARVYARPRDIEPGRFAVLGDPWGAALAVFTPRPMDGMGMDKPDVDDFSWHELATENWQQASEFYSTLFGWEHASSMDMGSGNTYWMFKPAGAATEQMMGGIFNRPPEMKVPSHWLSYIHVPSADTAVTAITRAGGKVLNGPMEVPGGSRIAQCLDPQGAAFAVHSLAVPEERPRGERASSRPRRGTTAKLKASAKAKPAVKKSKPRRSSPARARRRRPVH